MIQKFSFHLFFIYFLLQGAIRKWMFPSLGTPLYLLTYVLLIIYYFFAFSNTDNRLKKINPGFKGLLLIYFVYGALEIFNLRGTDNLIVQFYGSVMHFGFIPILFTMSRVWQNDQSFDIYQKWVVWIMVPLFILGIIQFYSPVYSFINRYAVDEAEGAYEIVAGIGGRARITGTFPYLAPYASFLGFILHILFYITVVSVIKGKLAITALIAYGLGIINIFMTGSRGSTLVYGLTETLTILILVFSGEVKFLKKIIPLTFLFGIGFVILQFTEAGSSAIGDFMLRLNSTSDVGTRLEDTFSPLKFAEDCGPFGFGIGTAQIPMGPLLTNRWEMPGYWEEEGERIVIELGVIGYFIVMGLRVFIFFTCLNLARNMKKVEYKVLAIQMSMYIAPYMINMQTNIFNYVDGLFYWVAVGLIYFAWQMDQKAKADTILEERKTPAVTFPKPIF